MSTVVEKAIRAPTATASILHLVEVFLDQTEEIREKVILEIIKTRIDQGGLEPVLTPEAKTERVAEVNPLEENIPAPIPIKVTEEEMSIRESPKRETTLERHPLV